MNTRTIRGVLVATAVLALALGACKKKPKDDKAKDGDKTMEVMKAAAMDVMEPAMKADAMKADAMKADAMKADAMKADAMKADAMKADAMDAKPVASGEAVTIKFDRPVKVGQKYKLVATGKLDNKATIDGNAIPGQNYKMTYTCEAEVTIKAVHTNGQATKTELKILKLQAAKDGAAKELLPKDAVVLAEVEGGKEKFTAKGKPLDKVTSRILGFVVDLYDGDPSTTDELLGLGGPKKPGDTWKMDAAKLLANVKHDFKKATLMPKLADVSGTVTFVGLKKVNGMDVVELKATFKLNNIAPKMGPIKTTKGNMQMGLAGWIPKDPKVVLLDSGTKTMIMHVEGELAKGGKTLKVVVDVNMMQKVTTTPLK